MLRRVYSEYADAPAVGFSESFDTFERRGLARTVRSEQAEYGPRQHVERQVVDRANVSVLFREITNFYCIEIRGTEDEIRRKTRQYCRG